MNIDETIDALSKAGELANVAIRLTHAIEHFERDGQYNIATDTIRAIMRAALDENVLTRALSPKEYNKTEFEKFLTRATK